MRKSYLQLFLLILPSIALAGNISVSSPSSEDGTLTVSIALPPHTEALEIEVRKSGETQTDEMHVTSPSGRIYSQKIYFKSGAGSYSIETSALQSIGPMAGTYAYLDSTTVTNLAQSTTWLFPSDTVQVDAPEIQTLARSLTEGLGSDEEKSRAIHDWIARNISYDMRSLGAVESTGAGGSVASQDALSVLRSKTGICQGYSDLNAALHRAVGIQAQVIHGIAEAVFTGSEIPTGEYTCANAPYAKTHAWNQILIDGKWQIQDVTWDAGVVDPRTGVFKFASTETYLFPDTKTFGKTHVACGATTD